MTPGGAAAAAAAGVPEGVVLLPGFDPWVLAPISHRAHTIPDGHVDDVSRPAGWISPVLLVDGRVAGTWEPATQDGVTTVTVTPFARLPKRVVTGRTRAPGRGLRRGVHGRRAPRRRRLTAGRATGPRRAGPRSRA